MKKKLFLLISLTVFFFSSCIITNNFSANYRLALNAIASGSKDSVKEYSAVLKNLAETRDQISIAYMISGYGQYLSGDFNKALNEFITSNDYQNNNDSNAGIILCYFMLDQYKLLDFYLGELDTFEDDWLMTVNYEILNQTKLYEICALSSAISKNKELFDTFESKVSVEKFLKMEGFFFE